MDTKIAFFDIDGTLINVPTGLNEPTQETKDALKKFRAQGNKIVIASARGELPFNDHDMEFDGYICSEGHYIRYHDEVLVDQQFEVDQIHKQLEVYEKYHGVPMFYGRGKSWCAHQDNEMVLRHREMFQSSKDKDAGEIVDFQPEDIQAVSCCVLFSNVEELLKASKELEDEFTMVLYEKGLTRMDVYCKGYTKGTACEFIYQKLGIDFDNTYAFGDGVNDLRMFELVKHGIAMGNAVEELKEIAFDVTDTVDNDGIAKALKKHFHI
ncbi:MAG: HAD family hydrolase [Coprobacillus sp.]